MKTIGFYLPTGFRAAGNCVEEGTAALPAVVPAGLAATLPVEAPKALGNPAPTPVVFEAAEDAAMGEALDVTPVAVRDAAEDTEEVPGVAETRAEAPALLIPPADVDERMEEEAERVEEAPNRPDPPTATPLPGEAVAPLPGPVGPLPFGPAASPVTLTLVPRPRPPAAPLPSPTFFILEISALISFASSGEKPGSSASSLSRRRSLASKPAVAPRLPLTLTVCEPTPIRTGRRLKASLMTREEEETSRSLSVMTLLTAVLSRSRQSTSSGSRITCLRAGNKVAAWSLTFGTGS